MTAAFNVLKPVIAVVVASLFTRFVTMGYLTPQDASALTKSVMDLLAVGVPAASAGYLAWKATPQQLIRTVDKLPDVAGVAVTPTLARAIDSPTVTTIERLPDEVSSKG